jgi:aminoglycoside 6'-N-acetyltransferase I
MRVRPVGPGDLRAWCRMRTCLWPAEPEGDLLREARAYVGGAGPLSVVFLCEAAPGQALGMIELSLRSYAEGCSSVPVPYVEGWYVVPEARRLGVGRALIAAAEEWARERGYTEIASDAVLDNRESERAHLALGFEEVERAIHFRKELRPAGGTTPKPMRSP